jgi:lipopolysaccharide export system ATP-binding protein
VDDVSVTVATGEIVGLLGPNGAGKTTTFKMIVGFTDPTKGRVTLDERDISAMPLHERARLGISYLPQDASVFRRMTVRDNIKAVLEAHGVRGKEMHERVDRLIEEMGLETVERSMADRVSGGERRRVEIARALALNPRFILLDEPFAAIDPPTVEELQRTIAQLRDRGLGVLITDHNVRETLYVTDRSYLMEDGRVVVSGTSREIAENSGSKSYITDRIRRDLLADAPRGAGVPPSEG